MVKKFNKSFKLLTFKTFDENESGEYSNEYKKYRIQMFGLNEKGDMTEHYFDGLHATCAQHEIDHLNGVLFIDYLGPIRRQIITSKMKKYKKEISKNVNSPESGK